MKRILNLLLAACLLVASPAAWTPVLVTAAAVVCAPVAEGNVAALVNQKSALTRMAVHAVHAGNYDSARRLFRNEGRSRLAEWGGQYVALDGAAGCYLSTLDSAAQSLTGVIDIKARIAPTNWATNTGAIRAHWQAGLSSVWRLETGGLLRLGLSTDGMGVAGAYNSTTAVPFSGSAAGWVRVTRDPTSGEVKYFTAPDSATEPASWSQLGTTISGATGALYNSTSAVEVGSVLAGSANLFAGKIYRVIASSTIDGAAASDFDASRMTNADTYVAVTGETWTRNGTAQLLVPGAQHMPITAAARPTICARNGSSGFVCLPGTAGNYVSTPDADPLDITGDIDLRWYGSLVDWTPSAVSVLMGKDNGSNTSFRLAINTSGTVILYMTTDGTTLTYPASSAATGIADGAASWVRATWRASDGRVQFFLSSDGSSWAQLGTDMTNNIGSIYAGTATLIVGGYNGGASNPMAGRVYRAQVYNGIAGTLVADFDATRFGPDANTLTASTGEVWTVAYSATGLKSSIVHPSRTSAQVLFDGSDDYTFCPDDPLLDFGATDSFTAIAVVRQHGTPAAYGRYIGKRGASGSGYAIASNNTNTKMTVAVSDGTASPSATSGDFTSGSLSLFGLVRSVADDKVYNWLNGASANTTDTTTDAPSNELNLLLGSRPDLSERQHFELVAAQLHRRALTAYELRRIAAEIRMAGHRGRPRKRKHLVNHRAIRRASHFHSHYHHHSALAA